MRLEDYLSVLPATRCDCVRHIGDDGRAYHPYTFLYALRRDCGRYRSLREHIATATGPMFLYAPRHDFARYGFGFILGIWWLFLYAIGRDSARRRTAWARSAG